MMFTRKLALLSAIFLTGTLSLTACSSDSSGGSASPATSQLNKVIKKGTIRVAVLPDFPPWAAKGSDGKFKGFEIDIAKKLADSLGVKLKLVSTDGDSRLPLMKSNRVDVNISAWTATDERAKAVGFTIPYDAHGAGVLFKKGANIKSYDDLAGKKVSVARGSTNDTIITNDFKKTKAVRFDSIADVIGALKAGKVDAAVESAYTVKNEAEKDSSLKAISDPPLEPQLVSMGVLPNDQVWINYLNNFIRNLIASGTDNKLHNKWLHSDLAGIVSVKGNAS